MKRMLGFVLIATVVGPPGSSRQTCCALVVASSYSATAPDSRRQHFINTFEAVEGMKRFNKYQDPLGFYD